MNRAYLRYLPGAAALLAVLLVVGVVVYLVLGFLKEKPENPKHMIQQITLIQPPPPPPEVKPPEPEIKQEVDIPKPQETPQNQPDDNPDKLPPIGDNLGLDALGGAGGDAFGLIGKQGGRDLIGGGGGNRFSRYVSLVQDQISATLSEDEAIRRERYSVVVHLWVGGDGNVERCELVKGTGKRDLDKKLRQDLAAIRSFDEAPSVEMPQPIKLRISSRS